MSVDSVLDLISMTPRLTPHLLISEHNAYCTEVSMVGCLHLSLSFHNYVMCLYHRLSLAPG